MRLSEYDLNSDPDGDGLSTGVELAIGTDPTRADTDGDGLSDATELEGPTDPLDPDSDDDGIGDAADFCPTQAGSDSNDLDGDHFGDSCDNCPRTHNPDQVDRGGILTSPGAGDGVGDACQSADFNQDGKVDLNDVTLLRRAIAAHPPGVDPSMPP